MADDTFGPQNTSDDRTQDLSLDDLKHQEAKSPALTGEENVASGDSTTSEPLDIDQALEEVGLPSDEEGVKPLGIFPNPTDQD